MRDSVAPLLLAACLALGGNAANAQDAADGEELGLATVTAVKGTISPPVAPFTTLDAPARFELGGGASMTIVHLRSCERVEVNAGRVEVAFGGIATSAEAKRERVRCPGQPKVQTSGVAGGILMRSIGPAASGQPRVVIDMPGGVTLKRGANVTFRVASPISGALYVFDQDERGALTEIEGPRRATGGVPLAMRPGAFADVPDPAGRATIQAQTPGEGRVIAFAVPVHAGRCGMLDLFEARATRPATLSRLTAAMKARRAEGTSCPPGSFDVASGDLIYTVRP
ncbi:hypothetical protein [Alsobacter sp. R-9]